MLDDDPGPSERLRARLRANPEVIEAYLADSRLFDLLFGGSESDRIRVLTPALAFAFGLIYVSNIFSWIPLYPWISRVIFPIL